MTDLTPVQQLQTARDLLVKLRDESTPKPWESCEDDLTNEVDIWHDQEHRSHIATLGVAGMSRVLADADLIVTLHATIDAQIDLLDKGIKFLSTVGMSTSNIAAPFVTAIVVLADSILGAVQA